MRVLLLLCAISLSTVCLSQSEQKTTIVFVCEHGGARSTIASLYFNKMAKEQHLQYQSVFRALTPDSTISLGTKKGLTADGFETTALTPVALTTKDIESNTLLISLDCKIPSSYHATREWSGIPAISKDYEAAQNEIVAFECVNQ